MINNKINIIFFENIDFLIYELFVKILIYVG